MRIQRNVLNGIHQHVVWTADFVLKLFSEQDEATVVINLDNVIKKDIVEEYKDRMPTSYSVQHIDVHNKSTNYAEHSFIVGHCLTRNSQVQHHSSLVHHEQHRSALKPILFDPCLNTQTRFKELVVDNVDFIPDPRYVVNLKDDPTYPCLLNIYLTHPSRQDRYHVRMRISLSIEISFITYKIDKNQINKLFIYN